MRHPEPLIIHRSDSPDTDPRKILSIFDVERIGQPLKIPVFSKRYMRKGDVYLPFQLSLGNTDQLKGCSINVHRITEILNPISFDDPLVYDPIPAFSFEMPKGPDEFSKQLYCFKDVPSKSNPYGDNLLHIWQNPYLYGQVILDEGIYILAIDYDAVDEDGKSSHIHLLSEPFEVRSMQVDKVEYIFLEAWSSSSVVIGTAIDDSGNITVAYGVPKNKQKQFYPSLYLPDSNIYEISNEKTDELITIESIDIPISTKSIKKYSTTAVVNRFLADTLACFCEQEEFSVWHVDNGLYTKYKTMNAEIDISMLPTGLYACKITFYGKYDIYQDKTMIKDIP